MKHVEVTDYKNGIYNVDSGYEGGGVASIYIARDSGRAAIIDTAHNAAIEPMRAAMRELGISGGDVDYIFITHVHLDHVGGAGIFANEFPNSRVVVHKRGARHLINPEKLVKGATDVYGEETMERLYGTVLPVPEDRIDIPEDGDEFRVGGRTIICMDTPGHARHHMAYHDADTNSVFTGDSFGMSYLELRRPDNIGVMLTTSPVQFDPEAMRSSMKRIEALGPEFLYPTHFGQMPCDDDVKSSLYRQIDRFVELAENTDGDLPKIREGFKKLFAKERDIQNCPCFTDESCRLMGIPMELNAQGLAIWYAKDRNRK
ncbi:MAG: MBL fold metallo-hydrolase [Synergistaceae bacterium]|jgi:glyoxylase-like metal-dependent hydrolase (beta-lactamase superfamily II)|nr:MBL fold metallo-hydrolase [Synergistaceae bacterium]